MKLFLFLIFLKSFSALLIVSKYINEPLLVKNKNITVLMTITNKGTAQASEILLHDQTFNNGSAFKIVSGKNYQKVPDLPVNSTYKTSFVVMSKVSGTIKSYPAVVKYSVDGVKYTAFSSFKGMFVESQNALVSTLTGWAVFIIAVFLILKANYWLKNSGEKKKH